MSFDFNEDPFENFFKSLKNAELKSKEIGVSDYNAMSLTTVDQNHKPSIRTVLFKGLRDRGFSFFTHYDGRKGLQILNNNHVALNFFWPYLNHQINIIGFVNKLSPEESDQYFLSRDRLSQIGAWASDQSQNLSNRNDFIQKIEFYKKKFQDQIVPRPVEWGGYTVQPLEIEFWFAAEGRLHERYIYQRTDTLSEWKKTMRYP